MRPLALEVARYATDDCNPDDGISIFPSLSERAGTDVSLEIGDDGPPIISSFRTEEKDLRFTRCLVPDCSEADTPSPLP